ncbi:uncharacterized protein LOC6551441 [Drosophila erecta]|uniref:Uncharacterized protein n=1 Tax=Drosophila erecta TaxID=7220 RepID=B3NTQ3_DROER|nr:uncharacterized protein LOC6551441 [Drosophila erecta]EDV47466.1 uncharacterized protein Dere_GG17624 [Drosophila erecta]
MALKMNQNQNQVKINYVQQYVGRMTGPLVEPIFPVPQMSSATLRVRRAVVESYRGPQIAPDDAMLPMPPHNKVQNLGEMLQELRFRLKDFKLWHQVIRLLKKRL